MEVAMCLHFVHTVPLEILDATKVYHPWPPECQPLQNVLHPGPLEPHLGWLRSTVPKCRKQKLEATLGSECWGFMGSLRHNFETVLPQGPDTLDSWWEKQPQRSPKCLWCHSHRVWINSICFLISTLLPFWLQISSLVLFSLLQFYDKQSGEDISATLGLEISSTKYHSLSLFNPAFHKALTAKFFATVW